MNNKQTLFYEEYGDISAPPLIILHGFFASLRNWRQIAKKLTEHYHIYIVDMRNHGRSPHNAIMDYPSMSDDIKQFISNKGIDKVNIIAHSMGGKVAMYLALNNPNIINKLIVVDISPSCYQHSFDNIIHALKKVPLAEINNRKQADDFLSDAIPELSFRQFLLQNLVLKAGYYQWRINLDFFAANANNIIAFPEFSVLQPFLDKVLFLAGGSSNYINEDDVYSLFPNADIQSIDNAGHWLHVEQPDAFCLAVNQYLQNFKRI
jgi:pimeloyl-ACP methyl ester carboxylesterase